MCIFGCNGAANPPETKSILSHLIDIAASAIANRSTSTTQTSTQSTDMSAKIMKEHMSKDFSCATTKIGCEKYIYLSDGCSREGRPNC